MMVALLACRWDSPEEKEVERGWREEGEERGVERRGDGRELGREGEMAKGRVSAKEGVEETGSRGRDGILYECKVEVSYDLKASKREPTHLATNSRPLQPNLARPISLRALDVLALQQLIELPHGPLGALLRHSCSLLILRRLDLKDDVQALLPAERLDVVAEGEAGEEGTFPAR